MCTTKQIDEIRSLIEEHIIPVLQEEAGNIDGTDSNDKGFSYVQQRAMINQIFQSTSGDNYNIQSIMLRLIVIDSLYSTNAAYSYFSFEEMAKAICELGPEDKAATYFYNLVCEVEKQDCKNNQSSKLFSSNYGIRKNLADGSKQMSLMSKYAYYVLLQNPKDYPLGFPIYDSLAIKMYPKVCELLKIESRFTESAAENNKLMIEEYINALKEIRIAIFDDKLYDDFQQYDLLDAYLWRMGKLDEGNYSLLLEREDYDKFIRNLQLHVIIDNKTKKNETRQKYKSRIFDPFKQIQLNNKKGKKINNGYNNEQIVYEYDFNDLVRYKCATMDIDKILDGVNNEHLKPMIEHWRALYVKENEYEVKTL